MAWSRAWSLLVALGSACGRLHFGQLGEQDDASINGDTITDSDGVTSGDVMGDAAFSNANRAFVTSIGFPLATIGSVANANTLCAQRAAAGGLAGTYVAFLSSTTVDARDQLGSARGWVRVDGKPIADTLDDLLNGRLIHPIVVDEFGQQIGNGAAVNLVTTGTGMDGRYDPVGSCTDFTSTAGIIRSGEFYRTSQAAFTSPIVVQCDGNSRLYCFGVDRSTPVALAPQTGRLVFVSSASFPIGTGIGAADTECQNEANAAARSGTFRAFLATSTTTAASRFSASGATWVRVDGLPIAPTAARVLAGSIEIPVRLQLDGTPYADLVYFGASTTTSAPTIGHCTDWTSTADSYTYGLADHAYVGAYNAGARTCSIPARTYCLEQ